MTKTATLPKVELNSLRKRVAETKSASTSRYYIAMLNRLEAYNQSPILDLSTVDSTYVSEFGDYLVREGVTFSTTKLFKMAFRAVLKEAYGSDFRAQFKAVFKDVGSKNETPTNCMSLDDLLKIANCKLEKNVMLERIRLVFLYCVVSVAISLEDLKNSLIVRGLNPQLPQQKKIIHDFGPYYEYGFDQYVSKLGAEQYAQALEVIGISSGISNCLKPQSAVEAWISIAKKANISATKMASLLPSVLKVVRDSSAIDDLSDQERIEILKAAANALFDMKPRWFVMKCYNVEPTEMDVIIKEAGLISEDETISSFIPPDPGVPKNKSNLKKSVISDLYFFNCTNSTASTIRKAVREFGWVYTLAGTSIPAQISDAEMKTFMLLCVVSEGTLSYHFPEDQSGKDVFIIGQEAKVIKGKLSGQVGIIKELSNNRYKVIMSFTSLCAKVVAEIPIDFLILA